MGEIKVFCGDCKHYSDGGFDQHDACWHPNNKASGWNHVKRYSKRINDAYDINRKNDCLWFKRNLISKIWRKLCIKR